jgi:hypothetical protein
VESQNGFVGTPPRRYVREREVRGAAQEEAFRARSAVAGKEPATLARELLAMSDEEFRIAFKGSPTKRRSGVA